LEKFGLFEKNQRGVAWGVKSVAKSWGDEKEVPTGSKT
jgi:hypothetical protein